MLKRASIILCAILFVASYSVAEINQCSQPTITTSTGDETVIKGVSTITITADEGDLISYTTNGDAPSTDIAEAFPSPLVLNVSEYNPSIKAIAVNSDKDPSVAIEYYPFTPSEKSKTPLLSYDTYNKVYINKATGYLAGPFLIYAFEELDNGKAWIQLRRSDDSYNKSNNSIIAELTTSQVGSYCNLKVGETIDYINIKDYPEREYSAKGGMKLVTSCSLPTKSNATDAQFQYQTISFNDTTIEYDWWREYWRKPIVFKNVTYREGKFYDLDGTFGLLLDTSFKKISSENFVEGHSYTIHGFAGTSEVDQRGSMRIFITDYVDLGGSADEVTDIATAFIFEGDERKVKFNCDLTFVSFNREKNHMFLVDANGGDIVLTGDFSAYDFQMGDVFNGLTANLKVAHNVRYGALSDETILSTGKADIPNALEIDVTDLGLYPGEYVSFSSSIGREYDVIPETPSAKSTNLTWTVGGIKINPSAISDDVAELVGFAAEDNYAGNEFKFKGMVMPDAEGNYEFWPTEVLTDTGDKPVTGIDEINVDQDGEIEYENGRPVMKHMWKLFDLTGRVCDAEKAETGTYILSTPKRNIKIVIR